MTDHSDAANDSCDRKSDRKSASDVTSDAILHLRKKISVTHAAAILAKQIDISIFKTDALLFKTRADKHARRSFVARETTCRPEELSTPIEADCMKCSHYTADDCACARVCVCARIDSCGLVPRACALTSSRS